MMRRRKNFVEKNCDDNSLTQIVIIQKTFIIPKLTNSNCDETKKNHTVTKL